MSATTQLVKRIQKCWVYELLVPMEGGGETWLRSRPLTYTEALYHVEHWERWGWKVRLAEVSS